jgi:hypothetical protein
MIFLLEFSDPSKKELVMVWFGKKELVMVWFGVVMLL